MIIFILAGRKSGKSTFAVNELLGKRKEDFVLYSSKEELTEYCFKIIGKGNFPIEKFKTQNSSAIRGRPPKYVICDDYNYFDKNFRKDLFKYYVTGCIEKIFLLASSNSSGMNDYDFEKIVSQTRDLYLNDYTSVERTNKINDIEKFGKKFLDDDVINIKDTIIINTKKGLVTNKTVNELMKASIVKQRFSQPPLYEKKI